MYFVVFGSNNFPSKGTLSTTWAKTTKARTKRRRMGKKIKNRKQKSASSVAAWIYLWDSRKDVSKL